MEYVRGEETKMSSQGLRYRSTETTEKSRRAGKRLAKFEKKALPRVELGFFSPPAAPAAGCIVSRRSAQVASALTHLDQRAGI